MNFLNTISTIYFSENENLSTEVNIFKLYVKHGCPKVRNFELIFEEYFSNIYKTKDY